MARTRGRVVLVGLHGKARHPGRTGHRRTRDRDPRLRRRQPCRCPHRHENGCGGRPPWLRRNRVPPGAGQRGPCPARRRQGHRASGDHPLTRAAPAARYMSTSSASGPARRQRWAWPERTGEAGRLNGLGASRSNQVAAWSENAAGANGRNGSRCLIPCLRASAPTGVRRPARTLRAPSARGPSSLPPWNHPMIFPSAMIWAAVRAMSLSRRHVYGVRRRSARPERGSRFRACRISSSVRSRPKQSLDRARPGRSPVGPCQAYRAQPRTWPRSPAAGGAKQPTVLASRRCS